MIAMDYVPMVPWTSEEKDDAAHAILSNPESFHGVGKWSCVLRLKGTRQQAALDDFMSRSRSRPLRAWYSACKSRMDHPAVKTQLHVTMGDQAHGAHADPIRDGGRIIAAREMIISASAAKDFQRKVFARRATVGVPSACVSLCMWDCVFFYRLVSFSCPDSEMSLAVISECVHTGPVRRL